MKKWLVTGLGNPEGKYFGTWHNLGFVAAERLAEELGIEFKKKGNMLLGDKDKVFIQKPLTYMNRSGEAVLALKRKHGLNAGNIIVLVDDLYIDKGKIKIVRGGTSGHNGPRNIKELLGNDEYIRIKIGIKPAKEMADMANYVLSRIPEAQRQIISEALENTVAAVKLLVSGESLELIQTKFNTRSCGHIKRSEDTAREND
ncbi:MAG: aminoacyl-tRNA hydrolase [Firmicutes bacterium]|nr:aminoacyl-tRNA hydrolase [Bacillota bacterium]